MSYAVIVTYAPKHKRAVLNKLNKVDSSTYFPAYTSLQSEPPIAAHMSGPYPCAMHGVCVLQDEQDQSCSGEEHNIQPGWGAVGTNLASSSFNPQVCSA